MSFNPRTPGGVRPDETDTYQTKNKFQSTHPGRGATGTLSFRHRQSEVSIHAPRAGCDWNETFCVFLSKVSIHAPRAGCDDAIKAADIEGGVSIHAPRAGCDPNGKFYHPFGNFVSIHAPRAGCD